VVGVGENFTQVGEVITTATEIYKKIKTSVDDMSMAFNALGGVKTAIIAVIMALILIFVNLYNSNEDFRNAVNALVDKALSLLNSFINDILIPTLSKLWEWIKDYIVPILTQLKDLFMEKVVPVLQTVANFIMDYMVPALATLFNWFKENIIPIIVKVADILFGLLGPAFEFVSGVAGFLFDGIKYLFEKLMQLWDLLKDTGVIDAVGKAFDGVLIIINKVLDAVKWLANLVGSVFSTVGNFFGGIGSFLFSSGGYGDLTGPANTLNLTTNINVHNTGSQINRAEIIRWGDVITDVVDENLGRRF